MKHDPHLANDLVLQSLLSKIARLEARVQELEDRAEAKEHRARRRVKASVTPAQAAIIDPILDRAARMNGCRVAEITGSRGSKRACWARAEAAFDCHKAGLSSTVIGRALGDREHSTILTLIGRHKDRMGIK